MPSVDGIYLFLPFIGIVLKDCSDCTYIETLGLFEGCLSTKVQLQAQVLSPLTPLSLHLSCVIIGQ